MRPLLILALALCAAAPLHAQRAGDVPRRPRLPAEADTNDARAYYRLGRDLLERGRAAPAADAFYWSSQLEPAEADPLYARYVALLMADPRRLALYTVGDPRTIGSAEVARIDSLYFRALRIDPFVQRTLERELAQATLRAVLTYVEGMSHAAASDAAGWMMREMPPMLRGRVLAGEGRLAEGLVAFDEALDELGDEAPGARRYVRHERARMYALAGNDSAALAELDQALQAASREEDERLVPLYASKAVLQHSRGVLHERLGQRPAAREAYAAAVMEDLAFYPAHVRLAFLAFADGDTAAALSEVELAVNAAPEEPAVLYTYATILAQLARLDAAAQQLARAAELAPFYADPWFALGVVRDGEGRLDAAREAYRAFLTRAPRGHRHRAAAEVRIRDLEAATAPVAEAPPPSAGAAPP